MWYKVKRIMIRPNGVERQVRPQCYGIDFRNNSKSNIQSDWWTFVNVTGTPSLSFSSNWLKLSASWTQLQINRTIDTTKYSKVIITGTGSLANNWTNWDWWLWLVIWKVNSNGYIEVWSWTGVTLAITRNVWSNASAHRWLWLWYDGSWHRTGTQQNAGEYTWELTIDLNTWAMTGTSSDWQSISWTMNSTWLWYVKSWTTAIWINFDGRNHIAHTYKAEFYR